MIEPMKIKTDLMIENYHLLKHEFKWEGNLARHFGAMVYATAGKKVDVASIRSAKQFIKEETSWTSVFRGINIFLLSCLLSIDGDYKTIFHTMQSVFDKLRKNGFRNSSYLPFAAYTFAKEVPEQLWDTKIARMQEFYNGMKKNHFWLTSADDYVFSAVLGATELPVADTSEKIEECYRMLNDLGFYKGNDLQTLSHILALGEEPVKDKCTKAMHIYHRLEQNKCKLHRHGLASVGVLTLLSHEVNATADEVKQIHDYLYTHDGYGFWSIDKLFRSILSANLICDYYVEGVNNGLLQITLCNSVNMIMIAQQQAMIAEVCAANAAESSGS